LTGETEKTITVLVNGDTGEEPNETFVVNLSNAQGATIADGQGVGTILDDDASVQPETYNSTDVPQEIADPHPRKGPRPATSEIDITSNDMIASLVVDVDITHGAEAGLIVMLESSSSSIGAQMLSYASPTDTWSLAAPNAFVGEPLGGTWTLTVTDEFRDGNTGTVESWSLTITPQAAGASPQSTASAADQALLAWADLDSTTDDEETDLLTGSLVDDLALMLME
jgi:subtilisin-like proprotein convertase family protein